MVVISGRGERAGASTGNVQKKKVSLGIVFSLSAAARNSCARKTCSNNFFLVSIRGLKNNAGRAFL